MVSFTIPLIIVVAQTRLLRTDTNGLTIAITSEDFTEPPQKMSIQIPSELLQFADNLTDGDGIVRAVSFLYYNVENLFPSGKPGDNG